MEYDEKTYPEKVYIGVQPHEVYSYMYPDGERIKLDPAPSLKLDNHSPDGFCWGYGGSGPTQLAIALLLDATSDPDIALQYSFDLKCDLVSRWPIDGTWTLLRSEILRWIEETKLTYVMMKQSRN